MNFFQGRLAAGEDGVVVFESDGWSVAVPSGLKSPGEQPRDEVVLGVRPERVSLSENASDFAFSAQVTLVEPLGDRVNVYARDGRGREVVAKLSRGESWSSGRQASVSLDLRGASFFEPGEDGLNLASVDAGPVSAVSGV